MVFNWEDKIVFICIVVVFIIMSLYMILFRDVETAVAFAAIDDGLYYPKIAQNIFKYSKITCDGITLTNGFHPLWLLIILPIYAFVNDYLLSLKLVYWLIFMILVVALWLYIKVGRQLGLSAGGIVLASLIMFFNFRSFTVLFSLIEAPVVLLIYLTYICFSLNVGEKRFNEPRAAFIGGLLMGIAFLARTDSVFLILGYGIILVADIIRKKVEFFKGLKVAFYGAAGVLVVSLPYLIANYLMFGHILPVSGESKIRPLNSIERIYYPIKALYSYFVPRMCFVLGIPDKYQSILQVIFLSTIIAIIIFALTGRRLKKVIKILAPMKEFALFSFIHFWFVYLFMPSEVFISNWYYISELILLGIILGGILPRKKWIDFAAFTLFIAVVIVQIIAYPVFVKNKKMSWAKLDIAEYIRTHIPSNARLAMRDAGIVSYFSQRDFIVLAGFAGDYELLDYIKNHQYKTIAEKYNVNYIVVPVPVTYTGPLPGEKVYESSIKTKYNDFEQPLKKFALIKGTPEEIAEVWELKKSGFGVH